MHIRIFSLIQILVAVIPSLFIGSFFVTAEENNPPRIVVIRDNAEEVMRNRLKTELFNTAEQGYRSLEFTVTKGDLSLAQKTARELGCFVDMYYNGKLVLGLPPALKQVAYELRRRTYGLQFAGPGEVPGWILVHHPLNETTVKKLDQEIAHPDSGGFVLLEGRENRSIQCGKLLRTYAEIRGDGSPIRNTTILPD